MAWCSLKRLLCRLARAQHLLSCSCAVSAADTRVSWQSLWGCHSRRYPCMHACRCRWRSRRTAAGAGRRRGRRTNLLSEVVPLEAAQVLEAPEVVVVGAAPLAAHGVAVQGLRDRLGHALVPEFHPALAEVLAAVAAQLLAPLARGGVCAPGQGSTSKELRVDASPHAMQQ